MDADENNSQIGCNQIATSSSIGRTDDNSYDSIPDMLCPKIFNKAKAKVLQ